MVYKRLWGAKKLTVDDRHDDTRNPVYDCAQGIANGTEGRFDLQKVLANKLLLIILCGRQLTQDTTAPMTVDVRNAEWKGRRGIGRVV